MCGLTADQSVTFSDSLLAPSEARNFVRQQGCPEHGALAMGALLLVASELVTNAVRHGRPPIVLHLSCRGSEVRLSVCDTGPDLPRGQGTRVDPGPTGARLPREGPRGGQGLGLIIVAKTAREWGTTPLASGKEVWSRVSTGVLPGVGAGPRGAGFGDDASRRGTGGA